MTRARSGNGRPSTIQRPVFRVDGENGAVLIFDIGANGKIKAWRVGVPPQIDHVEGCS